MLNYDDRVVGDQMGMLATIMNALALSFLNRNQVVNKVFSALGIAGVAKDYDKNDALEVLSSGSVGILREEQVILFLPLIRRLV